METRFSLRHRLSMPFSKDVRLFVLIFFTIMFLTQLSLVSFANVIEVGGCEGCETPTHNDENARNIIKDINKEDVVLDINPRELNSFLVQFDGKPLFEGFEPVDVREVKVFNFAGFADGRVVITNWEVNGTQLSGNYATMTDFLSALNQVSDEWHFDAQKSILYGGQNDKSSNLSLLSVEGDEFEMEFAVASIPTRVKVSIPTGADVLTVEQIGTNMVQTANVGENGGLILAK